MSNKNISTPQVISYSHTATVSRLRTKFQLREKAAYLILRRRGLSYNQIAECFGRSYSVIHRAIRNAEAFHHNLTVFGRRIDIRKLPYAARMHGSVLRRKMMLNLQEAWALWVIGEGEKPP